MKKQAFNPYLPSYEYVPDGEPYVFGDRVYIFGSHDRFGGSDFCQNPYVCWSAPVDDLGNWRYDGVIYRKEQDPMCKDEGRMLFAPDVAVGADGRYYLYYGLDYAGTLAVAVCDTPAGEYQFLDYIHYPDGTLLGQRQGDAFQYDPGVLVDDDGRVFLYSGFCAPDGLWEMLGRKDVILQGGLVIELERDMVTVKSEPKAVLPWVRNEQGAGFEGHAFFEASSMRKINGTYYWIYSSTNGHELCYATSRYPDRDFTYGGTIISNGDIGYHGRLPQDALNYTSNDHGSVIQIGGEWYVFYHRHTNGTLFARQGCAEKIEILPDGSIPQVEMTSCGLNGAPLIGEGTYQTGIACNLMSADGAEPYQIFAPPAPKHPYITQSGTDREDSPDQYVANLTDGAVAGFKYFALNGLTNISARVRGTGTGVLRVSTSLRGEPIADIPVAPSTEWTESSAALPEPVSGVLPLYFSFHGSGAIDFSQFTLSCVK
jgi:hypothetical protein